MKLPADIPTGPYEIDEDAAKCLVAAIATQFAEDTTWLRTAGLLGKDLQISREAEAAMFAKHKGVANRGCLFGTMDIIEARYVAQEWKDGIVERLCSLLAECGIDNVPTPDMWRRAAVQNIGALGAGGRGKAPREYKQHEEAIKRRDLERRRRQTKGRVKEFRDCPLEP